MDSQFCCGSLGRALAAALLPLLGSVAACGQGAPLPPQIASHAAAVTLPSDIAHIGYEFSPADPGEISLTFDDGPDGYGYTEQILDTLRDYGVQATFFINTHNAMNVKDGPDADYAQWLIQRMLDEGHGLGNHSDQHLDWSDAANNPQPELKAVEDIVHSFARYDASDPPLYLVRAPYGNPYDGPQRRLNRVAPVVARHGVHILWQIDPSDWACSSSQCVIDHVLEQVDAGASGIVLLHANHPWAAEALPTLLNELWARDKYFVQVADLVAEQYHDTPYHLTKAYLQRHPR